jgi:NADPH:quinone reductase-like Zn-dependent oxidoreductase
MNTMKAVRLFEFGGPDKLRYGDQPMPEVGTTDVLVKVLATSVSRWDIKYRTGEVHEFYGKSTGHHGGIHGRRAFPMPMQLGRDVAGEVAAMGASVTTLAPDDRVLGMTNPENTLSLASIRGLGNLSGGIDLPGHTMFGGYAQFVSRPENYWIKVRPDLDLDQGAAAMWPCATAHHIITNRLNVRMNDNVLITGASGGMGTATIALAKLAGATVIATTRHPGKAASLERWGADIVVDSGGDDAVKAIRAATGGEGVDAAVEYTGASELMRLCIDALRLGGTFCPVGGELREIPLRVVDMVSKELNVHGVRGATRNDQRVVAELLEKGRIRMPIHAVLPLAKAAEAHAMLEHSAMSWAASCCIPGTMFERWRQERRLRCRAQKSVAMPLTSQSP